MSEKESYYFWKIVMEAVSCPFKEERLAPNGDFGGYWCKHPSIRFKYKIDSKILCVKEECPLRLIK